MYENRADEDSCTYASYSPMQERSQKAGHGGDFHSEAHEIQGYVRCLKPNVNPCLDRRPSDARKPGFGDDYGSMTAYDTQTHPRCFKPSLEPCLCWQSSAP